MTIFGLLVLFQLKHFLCDFPLQGRYMLGKFKPGWEFLKPLSAHCGVHAVFTLVISCFFVSLPFALGLALFDFLCHFAMDRIKAGPKYLGRWKPNSPFFWWALGLDQMWHHLTHYAIIYLLVKP